MDTMRVTMDTIFVAEGSKKVAQKINCEKCCYYTSRSSNWAKHIKTKKHKDTIGVTMDTIKVAKVAKSSSDDNTKWNCECGKQYAHRQGLYKHKRACTFVVPSNTELVSKMFELVQKMEEKDKIISDLVLRVGNNNNNTNTNNIIIQLNSNYPNAIPIQDLYEKINDLPKCVCHDPKLLTNALVDILQSQNASEKTIRSIHDTMYVKHRDAGFIADDNADVFDLVKKQTEKSQLSKAAEQNSKMFIREKDSKEYPEIVGGLTKDLTTSEKKQMKNKVIKAICND
jgi:hypothetical protein